MSTTEPLDRGSDALAEPWDDLETTTLRGRGPRVATAIVPKSSIAGSSLIAVVAIMTFLAGLTCGAVTMIVSAASDWRSDLARAAAGIADVRVYTKDEPARLVEPWLGNGVVLDELPIPRMIVVRLRSGASPNFSALRQTLAAQVPSATLDDHRRWIDRMRAMAGTAAAAGLAILLLVLVVAVLSVTFATRGAMATNRPIIEVLHYVGATDSFVSRQFQRHFLILGFKGGAIGGGGAILLFGLMQGMNAWVAGTPGGDEAEALFGSFSLGAAGYLAIFGQIVLMAVVTALASRRTVNRTLATVD